MKKTRTITTIDVKAVRRAMIDADIKSMSELCRKVGITRGYFGRIVAQEENMETRMHIVEKIADALNVPIEVVLGDNGNGE